MPVYQQLCKGMNLVQMGLMGPLKAYVLDLNAPMNATPKMNNFAKKCIFLGEKNKSWWWTPCLSSQTFWDHREHEVDGSERKSGRASPQRALAEKCHEAKKPNKFGLLYQHKRQAKRTTSNKGGT
jgi:hypothetical protein